MGTVEKGNAERAAMRIKRHLAQCALFRVELRLPGISTVIGRPKRPVAGHPTALRTGKMETANPRLVRLVHGLPRTTTIGRPDETALVDNRVVASNEYGLQVGNRDMGQGWPSPFYCRSFCELKIL